MKVKVIRKFKDKQSKKVREVGETIEVTRERYGELTTSPFGVFVEEVKREAIEEKPKKKKK